MTHTSDTSRTAGEIAAWVAEEEARLSSPEPRLVFTHEEYADRQSALRSAMIEQSIDVFLSTSPDGMCWLHGYDSRWYRSHSSTEMPSIQCTIVRADEGGLALVETSYHKGLMDLTSSLQDFRAVPGSADDHEPTVEDFVGFLVEQVRLVGQRLTVALEYWSSVPSPAVLVALREALTAHGHRVVDGSRLLRSLRRLKSPAEIALVERAQTACDAGIRAVQALARPGMTELEAWATYMTGSVAAGGEPTAMHETIAVGKSLPAIHATSSRRPIRYGEYFYADMASAVHRYHARATRILSMGPPPAPLVAEARLLAGVYDVVAETALVGTPFRDVHAAVRRYFTGVGIDGWVGGYELGLSFPPDWVGEFTWGSSDTETEAVVEAGLVTNIEMFSFGALVDTVVFAESGPRFLSTLPRDVLVCEGSQ